MFLFTTKSTLSDSIGIFFSQRLWNIAKFGMALTETCEAIVTEGFIFMTLNQVVQNSKNGYFSCFSLLSQALQALSPFFLIPVFSEIKR